MEPAKDDHWNFLADELGAEVKPEQPAASVPPPPAPRPKPEPRREVAPAARAAADWTQLASSLGIEAPLEEPSPGPPPPSQASRRTEPPARHQQPPRTPDPAHGSGSARPEGGSRSERPDDSRRGGHRDRHDRGGRSPEGRSDRGPRDARENRNRSGRRGEFDGGEARSGDRGSREPIFDDPDEPVDELDRGALMEEIIDAEIVDEFDAEPASFDELSPDDARADSGPERPDGKRRRRRRRGRRGRSDRGGDSGERADNRPVSSELSPADSRELGADEAFAQSSADDVQDDIFDEGGSDRPRAADSGSESRAPDDARSDETGDERRGRRRRRRRGSRGRKPEQAAAAGAEAAPVADEDYEFSEDEVISSTPASGMATGFDADLADDDDEHDGALDRHSHRGIPSWTEAMSHIIDGNMEARAKFPRSGNPRGRGRGRGRPGGRHERP